MASTSAWSVKKEIKEEIPDENEHYDTNIQLIQNVKDELLFEDDLGNYEYATVADGQQQQEDYSNLETDLLIPLKLPPNSYNLQREHYFDYDDDDEYNDDEVKRIDSTHAKHENQVFVDGEPEIYVENISENNCSKEYASDPLAINTDVIRSNDNRPTAILNSTHTPVAAPSVKMLVRRRKPSPPISPLPPPAKPPQLPVQLPIKKQRKKRSRTLPPEYHPRQPSAANELFRKTYSVEHRLAYKTDCNTCQVCARKFYNPSEFETHRRKCFFGCKKCNLIFQTATQLKAHYTKCSISLTDRKRKTDWIIRMRKKSGSPSSSTMVMAPKRSCKKSCDICCTTFNSKHELDLHREKNHLVKNAYACHKCEQRFDDADDAKLHLKYDH